MCGTFPLKEGTYSVNIKLIHERAFVCLSFHVIQMLNGVTFRMDSFVQHVTSEKHFKKPVTNRDCSISHTIRVVAKGSQEAIRC